MSHLNSSNNQYGGTYVSPRDLPADKNIFDMQLLETIQIWRNNQIKVVWIKIPNKRAELLPLVYKAGFVNHHSGADFVVVTLSLEKDATIPPFATHTIGVGGLIINEQNEILTIREKAHIHTHPNNWKFPGGLLDPSEHLEQGVMREVMEETGIETRFEQFLGFRHHHQGQFGRSNIYAVCRLTPLSYEIKIQESEIADARWFAVDEYLNDKKVSQYNQQIVSSALNNSGLSNIKLPGYMGSDDAYEVFMAR